MGATLYCLLTGKPPFEDDDVGTILRRVQIGEFARPRSVNPTIDNALEAVCLKAMALKPEDRYAHPRALDDDLERWLGDEPVTAWREPLSGRARRWARRHRSLVTGASVLMVSALVALSAGLFLLGQASAKTEQQRRLAEANFVEARTQRDLAQKYFSLARGAVDENVLNVSEDTLLKSSLPGLQPLREKLLLSALKYYQQFLGIGGKDTSMRAELASAYFRVGSISAELGKFPEALAYFERARDVYNSLMQSTPDNAQLGGDLARIHRGIGRMLASTQRSEEAFSSFKQAIALGEELVQIHPDKPEFQHDLAWSYNNLGTMFHREGQPAEGLRCYQRAIHTWERLIRQHPDAEFRIGLGQAYSNLGWQLSMSGQLDEALEANKKAVALSEEVVRQESNDHSYRSRLSNTLDNLGTVAYFAGQFDLAKQAFQRALDVAEPLALANPAVIEYQETVVAIQNDLGHLLLQAGDPTAAKQAFESALESARRISNANPKAFSYAYIYRGLGKLERAEGHFDVALTRLQEAVRIGRTNPGEKPYSTYELACALALCGATTGEGESTPSAEVQAEKHQLADQAVASLRQAIADGWHNAAWMTVDPDLDSIRSRTDFQALVRESTMPKEPISN